MIGRQLVVCRLPTQLCLLSRRGPAKDLWQRAQTYGFSSNSSILIFETTASTWRNVVCAKKQSRIRASSRPSARFETFPLSLVLNIVPLASSAIIRSGRNTSTFCSTYCEVGDLLKSANVRFKDFPSTTKSLCSSLFTSFSKIFISSSMDFVIPFSSNTTFIELKMHSPSRSTGRMHLSNPLR